MSYQVLARKWRPKTFASLVGQGHVVKALSHALQENRLHHAYLFTGTRGVGKTTIARILSKSLNCESGVSAEPCGQCSSCIEIDTGRFVDLLEVDAATNTRVDEMRQLLENAIYAPTRGRYKVYVIDEVHMLSNSAFNAMLKTLEEPPEHVKFILATTDPQKIPVTVLSRCLQFNLKQMLPHAVAEHLRFILSEEGIPFEDGALALLARSANGSMRDALSLLDQAIAHGTGRVELALVRDMLGTVDQEHLLDLMAGLIAGDVPAMLDIANGMAVRSLSFDSALQELAALLTQVQLLQFAPAAAGASDASPEKMRMLAQRFSPEFVQLAYQIAIHGRDELPLAPDAHSGFVMALLRMYAFAPGGIAKGVPLLPPSSPALSSPVPPVSAPSSAPSSVAPAASEAALSVAQVMPAAAADMPVAPATASIAPAAVEVAAPPAEQVEVPAPVVPASPGAAAGNESWHEIMQALPLSGMARELAQHCELRSHADGLLVLRLSPAHRHLQMKPAVDKVQQCLSDYYGAAVQLRIELAEVESATPAVTAQQARRERQDHAVGAIEQDGFVRDVIEMFDATLIESSIKPV